MSTSTDARSATYSSRRAVVRGAAWSVPVVAVAATAPAYAASQPCSLQTASTMNLSTKSGSDGTTVSWKSVFAGGAAAGSGNLTTNNSNAPANGWLMIENTVPNATSAANPSKYQDVTLTFSQPVSELTFTVADIDSNGGSRTNEFWDRVAISDTASPFTATPYDASVAAISGGATITDPLRQTTFTDASTSSNAASNAAIIKMTGTTSSVTMRFWTSRSNSVSGTHWVFIGQMKYKVNCVPGV